MLEREKEGEREGVGEYLGGGESRTRERGCGGAGPLGGGASWPPECPGTPCRSNRNSTSPPASCLLRLSTNRSPNSGFIHHFIVYLSCMKASNLSSN